MAWRVSAGSLLLVHRLLDACLAGLGHASFSVPDPLRDAIEIPRYSAIRMPSEARICIPELQLCRGESISPGRIASFSCHEKYRYHSHSKGLAKASRKWAMLQQDC